GVHDGHLRSHVHKNSEAPRSPRAASVRSPRYQNRSEDCHAPVRGGSGNPREGSSNPRWCRQPYAPHNLLRAWQRATLFEDDWNFASSAQRWNALSSTRWQISAALPPNFYLRDSADFILRLRRSRSAFVGMPLYRYFNSSFTSAKAFTANSKSSRECAADTCVRIRAVPCGTTGTKTRTTSTPRSGSLLANVGTAPRSALTI